MQYKCDFCQDTGSLNKFGPYYDCAHCDAADQRVALEKWCSETQQRGPSFDDCWAIHQRALAMAPKQEAPIVQVPYAWVNAGTERQQIEYATLSVGPDNPWRDSANAFPVYAAPAAANGAMTDEQIQQATNEAVKRGELSWSDYRKDLDGKYTIPNLAPYHFQFARAILAAAGPDAALMKALEGAMAVIDDYLAYTHDGDPWKEDARAMGEMDINDADNDGRIESWRAALSGAKGN